VVMVKVFDFHYLVFGSLVESAQRPDSSSSPGFQQ